MQKNQKEKFLERIKKANSEEYETSWNEEGIPLSKKKSEIKKGKQSRAQGAKFELKVRVNLEKDGWTVDKWTNNVDLEEEKIVKAKRKYNPFKKILVIGTGFPDFIAFKKLNEAYEIIGVESKINGILSKVEKEKCSWYLKNNIFSKILIAKATPKKGRKTEIEYLDFKERFSKSKK
jgi:hypothetical protein